MICICQTAKRSTQTVAYQQLTLLRQLNKTCVEGSANMAKGIIDIVHKCVDCQYYDGPFSGYYKCKKSGLEILSGPTFPYETDKFPESCPLPDNQPLGGPITMAKTIRGWL